MNHHATIRRTIISWPVNGFHILKYCPSRLALAENGDASFKCSHALHSSRWTLSPGLKPNFDHPKPKCVNTPNERHSVCWNSAQSASSSCCALSMADAFRGASLFKLLYDVQLNPAPKPASLFRGQPIPCLRHFRFESSSSTVMSSDTRCLMQRQSAVYQSTCLCLCVSVHDSGL